MRQLWETSMLLAPRLLIFLSSDSTQALYCSLLIYNDQSSHSHCIIPQNRGQISLPYYCHAIYCLFTSEPGMTHVVACKISNLLLYKVFQ